MQKLFCLVGRLMRGLKWLALPLSGWCVWAQAPSQYHAVFSHFEVQFTQGGVCSSGQDSWAVNTKTNWSSASGSVSLEFPDICETGTRFGLQVQVSGYPDSLFCRTTNSVSGGLHIETPGPIVPSVSAKLSVSSGPTTRVEPSLALRIDNSWTIVKAPGDGWVTTNSSIALQAAQQAKPYDVLFGAESEGGQFVRISAFSARIDVANYEYRQSHDVLVRAWYDLVPILPDNQIIFAQTTPVPGTELAGGSRVSFSTRVAWLLGSQAEADLVLQVYDPTGQMIASSWAYWIRRRETIQTNTMTMSMIVVPDQAGSLQLEAAFRDLVTSNIFAVSPRVLYPIKPTPKPSVGVSNVTPSVAPSTREPPWFEEPLTITIVGSNFVQGAKVWLEPAIQVSASRFINSTRMEADLIGFNQLAPSYRRVVVTNPDQTHGVGTNLLFISSLCLTRMEINQAVPMECSREQPGVANHDTIVRAWIECHGATCQPAVNQVQGRLHVLKGGQPIPGSPFAPLKPLAVQPVGQPYSPVARYQALDALNFAFVGDACLKAGEYEFVLEVNPLIPQELPPAQTSPDSEHHLVRRLPGRVFEDSLASQSLRIAVLVDGTNQNDVAEAMGYFDFLCAAYPISRHRVRFEYQAANVAFSTETATLAALKGWYDRQGSTAADPFTHAILFSRNPAFTDAGLSDCGRNDYAFGLYTGAFYRKSPVMLIKLRGDDTRATVAHEMGHNFLLGDTYQDPSQKSENNPADSAACQALGNGCPVENGNMDTLLRTVSIVLPERPDLVSWTKRDFMGNASRGERWINRHTWNYLHALLNASPVGRLAHFLDPNASGAGPQDWVVVSGTLATNQTGLLSTCFRYSGYGPASQLPDGDYAIEFQDSQQRVLQRRSFDVLFSYARDLPQAEPKVPFSMLLPASPGMTRIALKKGPLELASRSITAHAPAVKVLYPNAGETLNGLVNVHWSASDPDQDLLTYTVSCDLGSAGWVPVANNLVTTNWICDASLLSGTPSALFRITANDGFNDGHDTTDQPVSVSRKVPWVAITFPSDGDTIASGQDLVLQGNAYDLEDGYLPDSALTFTSSVLGELGTGRQVLLPTPSPGPIDITLTGRDSDNNRATHTIHLQVRLAEAAGPRLTLAVANRQAVLSWPAAEVVHVVQQADRLASESWQTVSRTPSWLMGSNVLSLTIEGPQQFYRLRQSP